jgi:hypothetical protein
MRAEPEQREEREGLIHILQSVSPSAMQCNARYGWIDTKTFSGHHVFRV